MEPSNQDRPLPPADPSSTTIASVTAGHDVFLGSTITINNPAGPPPIPLTRRTWRPWLRAQVTPRKLAIALAGLVVCSAALLILYRDPGLQHWLFGPPRLQGDFKLAIAQFGALDTQGRSVDSADADDLAQVVYEAVGKESADIGGALGANGLQLQLALAGPADTGAVHGASREQRAQAAATLAQRLNADLIVYGTLQLSGSGNLFMPEFYLPEGRLRDDEQLVGPYDFGEAIPLPTTWASNPALRVDVRAQVQARVHALAQFALGLGNYIAERYEKAGQYFQAAVSPLGWEERDGKEVLYLFLGKAAGKRGDFTAATAAYQHALTLNPEYARARVDLAEVQFVQARADCSAEQVDVPGLQAAMNSYRQALQARDQPPDSDIPQKVAFGLGQIALCLSQAEKENDWATAAQEFRQVIDAYTQGDTRLRNLAADSYANLALAEAPSAPDEPGSVAKYQQAAVDYRHALAVSERPDRQALFHAQLAYYEGQLQEYDQADADYVAAMSLDPSNADLYAHERQRLQQEHAGTQK